MSTLVSAIADAVSVRGSPRLIGAFAAQIGVIAAAMTLVGASGMDGAHASGYALREQSVTALGNAFAGSTAAAEDLSYMYFNPAGLTRQAGNQIVVGGSAVLPNLKIRNADATSGLGTPISGNSGGSNAADAVLVPIAYGLLDVTELLDLEDNVKLGIGVNVPFGLTTHYRDGWSGRYYALESQITTINANPALAWEVLDGLSIAAGMQLQYVDARLTNAIDFGSIGAALGIPGAVPTQQDGEARVSGDDFGYGYNLGVLFEPWTGGRLGASYRSAIHHTLRGNARFKTDSAGIGTALQAGGLFQNGNVNADVTTPESVSFGVYQALSKEWAVMGEAQYTRWSQFKDVTLKYNNPLQPDSITEHDWNNTWFLAVGATWKPSETWALRAGAAFDQDPIPKGKRTPRIPTEDRYWLSLGARYQPLTNVTIDFGYSHIYSPDASIDLSASQQQSPFVGSFSGSARVNANIFSLSVLVKF
ncbi:MAG: OmpP1/FadL family transporter [Rhodospirillales bacterium]|nr:OmpP1/FadL family transporter [Rhodospirillales bacterium]